MSDNSWSWTPHVLEDWEVEMECVYELQDFIDTVNCGAFIDYDGTAYWWNPERQERRVMNSVDDASQHRLATHVLWYNK